MSSLSPPRFSRKYWLNIGRFFLIIAALGLIALLIGLFNTAARLAQDALHPPHEPLAHTPAEYGLSDYQDVSFKAADGLTIRGWYFPSKNRAAVIVQHGNNANRGAMLAEIAVLVRHGYGVLAFDWRGQGQSDGDLVSFGEYEVRDLRAGVGWLNQRPDVDPQRIGGLGMSLGAATLALGAAEDTRIKAVVLEASFTTLGEVANYRTKSLPLVGPMAIWIGQQQAGVSAAAVRPIDAVCKISPRPVLLIYGALDDYIPPGSADQMFQAACNPKELWIVPGAGHGGYAQAAPGEYERRLVEFFGRNLP